MLSLGHFNYKGEGDHDFIQKKIAFLNVSVCRQDNGQLASKVYCKSTHMERYLAFESHHPITHKKAVLKSLTNRANNILTTSDYRAKELKQVTVALLACCTRNGL